MLERITSLALVLCLLVACDRPSADAYLTAPVEVGDVRDVVPAVGQVRPLRRIEVRADAPGRVVEVLVQANDPVRAGQVLARVRPDRRALDVAAARAELNAARAAVVEAGARAEQADRNLANRRTLADQDFISPAALTQAESDAQAATASLRRAEADAASAAVAVRVATGALDEVLIRAPTDGFVLSRHVEPGQVAREAAEDPLFVIASDTSQVLIEALVAEPDIGRVNRDVRVQFTVEAHPQRRFEGRVRDILRAPQEERNFVSYPVLIEADNPQGLLFPGMTASVEFIHADAREVIRAPIEALYFLPDGYVPEVAEDHLRILRRRGLGDDPDSLAAFEFGLLMGQGKRRVFVLEDGQPVMRAVRVGAQSPEYLEILEGLEVGELLITGTAGRESRGRTGP